MATYNGTSGADVYTGTTGDDIINGNGGNDQLDGEAGNDTVNGGDGNDTLTGGTGSDLIDGGAGDDFIQEAGDGAIDTLRGGDGNDYLRGMSDDSMDGGVGNDEIYLNLRRFPSVGVTVNLSNIETSVGVALDATTTVKNVEFGTIFFSTGGNTITMGTAAGFQIFAGGDSDTVYGTTSGDTIWGENGIDQLHGGDGNDTLDGGGSDDTLNGEAGDDTLKGGTQNDTLNGGIGNDTLDGGAGLDILNGDDGNDTITGGLGDTIDGGVGTDILNLDVSTDGGSATVDLNNFLVGGTVTFAPGTRASRVEGGTVRFGSGVHNITSVAGWSVYAGVNNDILRGGGQLFGEAGNDQLFGDTSTALIDGGADTDTITLDLTAMTTGATANLSSIATTAVALGSVSIVRVEQGTIRLGSGADQITLSSQAGILVYGGEGADTITASASGNLFYGEGGNDTLNGAGGIDQIYGGTGDDTINGNGGNDIITGGIGADTMNGGIGNDRFVFAFSPGQSESTQAAPDTIVGFVSGQDKIDIPTAINGLLTAFTGAALDFDPAAAGVQVDSDYIGDGIADAVWRYDSANNRVDLWIDADDDGAISASDLLVRLAGKTTLSTADFYAAFSAARPPVVNDTIEGTPNDDLLKGGGGDDIIHGRLGNDTIYGDSGNDRLFGDEGEDTEFGGSGNDYLEGGVGDDLDGGIGIDEVYLDLRAMTAAAVVDLSVLPASGTVQFGSSTSLTQVEYGKIEFGSGADQITLLAPQSLGSPAALYKLAVYAGDGADAITGSASADEAWGEAGDDTMLGLGGNDKLWGGDGNNALDGGEGDDQLTTGVGSDSLSGGIGADILKAGEGADTLNGGADSDTIEGGLGADIMTGGAGEDRYVFAFGIPRSESSPSTVDVITDFEGAGVAGGDIIDLPPFAGNLPLVFNLLPVDFEFTGFGQEQGYQLPFDLIGDGLVDVSWRHNAAENRVEIWADANDDGQFSEVDMLIHLQGVSTFSFGDLADKFTVWRGTQGNDSYTGNDNPITAYALGGDDVLNTLGGDDIVYAGEGADLVNGGLGNDALRGEGGNDTLNGEGGADSLAGGLGDDVVNGGADGDSITGDAGADQLNGDGGNDFIDGGEGADVVHGGAGDDTLGEGVNWGNSTFLRGGPASANHYYGDDGNDNIWLVTSAGAVGTVDGGIGNDVLHGVLGTGTMLGDAGADVLMAGGGDWSLDGGADNDTLYFFLADSAIVTSGKMVATGGTGADRFVVHPTTSSGEQDRITDFNAAEGDRLELFGITAGVNGVQGRYNGFSTILRGPMDPSLFVLGAALPGADLGSQLVQFWTVQSGGNTYLVGDLDRDLVFGANDFVLRLDGLLSLTEASFVAGTFIARAGTPGADTMTGTSGDDQLYGVAGNDTISGLDGHDALYGGLGDDLIDGGIGNDHIEAGDGTDTVSAGAGFDTMLGQGGNDTLNGDAGDDSLLGGDGSDILNGGDNNDALNGEAGDDTLDGGLGNDTLHGGTGNDVLRGGAGDDSLWKGYISSNYWIGYDGNVQLYGEDGNDSLLAILNAGFTASLDGGIGNDTLNAVGGSGSLAGGAGIDTLFAGGGAWTLDGGAENDNLYLYINAGATVTSGEQSAAGGTGADRFVVHHATRFGEQDRITDFNAAEGDRVEIAEITYSWSNGQPLGRYNGYSTILRGPMDPALFTLGAALPGIDLGNQVVQFWTVQSGGNSFLVGDLNRDLMFDANDFVLRFDGLVGLTEASFVTGTFIARAGTPGADTMNGTSGADQLYGVAGNDTINGLAGNDALYGGLGDDLIDGGADDDYAEGGDGVDTVNGGLGHDTLLGQAGNDTLNGDAGNDSLTGGDGNDTLNGGDDGDFLSGEAGDDTLNGGLGNDALHAGTGNDVLRGGVGEDSVQKGFVSSSSYIAFDGNSQLYGEDGNDSLLSIVNAGFTSQLEGGLGNDTLVGVGTGAGAGGSLVGGVGIDTLFAGGGTWTLDGGADADTLYFFANSGSMVATGLQSATGGTGADRFVVHHTTRFGEQDRITDFNAVEGDLIQIADITYHPFNGQPWGRYNGVSTILRGPMDPALFTLGAALPGADLGNQLVQFWTVQSGGNTYLVGDLNRDLVFDANDFVLRFDGLVALTEASFVASTFIARAGTPGADTLNGTSSADQLYGVAGDDAINGLEGNDALYGGLGDDLIDGGADDDQAEGGDGVDTIHGGAGHDTLLGQAGNDTLNGDVGQDSLAGGDGNDTLNGGDDGDYLAGEAGNDVLNGQFGTDTLVGGDGDDTLDGGADNDLLYGGTGTDRLRGGDANDTLIGEAGDDILAGGVGNDVLRGGRHDTLQGTHTADESDTADYSATVGGGVVIDLTITTQVFGYAGADQLFDIENLIGSTFADTLTGDGWANRLTGGAGNDTIIGGAGLDTAVFAGSRAAYTVSFVGETVQVQGPDGTDTLTGIERLAFDNGTYAFGPSGYGNPALLLAGFGAGASAGGWSSNTTYPRTLADVDGDGRADIVGFGDGGVSVALATGSGQFGSAFLALAGFGAGASAGGWNSNDIYPRSLADINGDGKADIVGFGDGGVHAALATSGGSFGAAFMAVGGFGAGASAGSWSNATVYPRMFADVNGDGMDDVVGFGDGGVHVALATGGGSFGTAFLAIAGFGAGASAGGWSNNDVYTRTLADMNGDGRADIVGFGSGGVHIALANPNGTFAAPSLPFAGFGAEPGAGGWTSNNTYYRTVGDLDGDGNADLVGFGDGGVHVAWGDGNGGFEAGGVVLAGFGAGASAGGWTSQDLYPRLLTDLNGDGAADIVGFGDGGVVAATSVSDWVLV